MDTTGILRPPQIGEPVHEIKNVHERRIIDPETKELGAERTQVWNIRIESIDSRITDILARAVSAVLHSWSSDVANAGENVLRELGKFEDDKLPEAQEKNIDITRDPETNKQDKPIGGDGN